MAQRFDSGEVSSGLQELGFSQSNGNSASGAMARLQSPALNQLVGRIGRRANMRRSTTIAAQLGGISRHARPGTAVAAAAASDGAMPTTPAGALRRKRTFAQRNKPSLELPAKAKRSGKAINARHAQRGEHGVIFGSPVGLQVKSVAKHDSHAHDSPGHVLFNSRGQTLFTLQRKAVHSRSVQDSLKQPEVRQPPQPPSPTFASSVKQLRRRVAQAVTRRVGDKGRGKRWLRAFAAQDQARSGQVTAEQFTSVLKSLGVDMSRHEMAKVAIDCRRMSQGQGLDYRRYLQLVDKAERRPTSAGPQPRQVSPPRVSRRALSPKAHAKARAVSTPHAARRGPGVPAYMLESPGLSQVLTRPPVEASPIVKPGPGTKRWAQRVISGITSSSLHSLREELLAQEPDSGGNLTAAQFRCALSSHGVQLSEQDAVQLARHSNAVRADGKLDAGAFLSHLHNTSAREQRYEEPEWLDESWRADLVDAQGVKLHTSAPVPGAHKLRDSSRSKSPPPQPPAQGKGRTHAPTPDLLRSAAVVHREAGVPRGDPSSVQDAVEVVVGKLRKLLPPSTAAARVKLRQALRKFDSDRDGVVNSTELLRGMAFVHPHITRHDMALISHQARCDHDSVNVAAVVDVLAPLSPPRKAVKVWRPAKAPPAVDSGRGSWASSPSTFEAFAVLWQQKHGAQGTRELAGDRMYNQPTLGPASTFANPRPFKVLHLPPSGH